MNNSSPLLFPTSILLQCQCLTHQSNIHQLQNKTKIEDYCPIIICRILTRITRRVSIVELELLTLPENRVHPRLLVGFVFSIFIFICMFCRLLFVLLCFFFWPLCCLFFFDIRILITPMVSSNSS